MRYTLENETLAVEIDSFGAEVKSVKRKSDGFEYTATGGGKYSLPVENAEKILIRNYISYDSQGIAQITDYRLVEYLCKEGK